MCVWYSPDGDKYTYNSLGGSRQALIYDLVDSYKSISAHRTSKHVNGLGMQHGIAWSETLCYPNRLKKKKEFQRLAFSSRSHFNSTQLA